MVGSHLETRAARWSAALERYRRGHWRAPIFRDLILDELAEIDGPKRVLDIGCGRGFDDDLKLQRSIAVASDEYIGIEPDVDVDLEPCFSATHRCRFEESQIEPASIDVAFAVMVLEHLADPRPFWNKLHSVLKPGGVFIGFTMDARHWFCSVSAWAGRLRIKDAYLNRVVGRRGHGRYENYPVHYRSNTPDQVRQYVTAFSNWTSFNFSREGQCDYYLPGGLRPLCRALDRRAIRNGKPGTVLAVRVCK